jgi:hypothetical protein
MSLAIVTSVVGLAGLVVVGLAVIAGRADETGDRHWRDLAQLQSDSGVAFFPTAEARLELEVALTEVLELERRPASARRRRTTALA